MLRHHTLQRGYNPLVQAGEMEYIELGIFRGESGDIYRMNTEDQEAVLVFLNGRCLLRVNHETYESIGGRRSVFDGNAWSLYAPNHTGIEIEILDEAEVAICTTRVPTNAAPKLIRPDEVTVRDVGAWNWRRDVKDIVDKRVPAARLLVGETINPPGNWSSWPPHKHDVPDPPRECKMEEVYLFKVQPSNSFGLGRLYTADGAIDEPFVIRDNTVLRIPRGYHPIAAAPGTRVYYLWVLAGEQRDLIPNDAPEFRWQKDTEAVIREMQRQR
jgi:5-deoxy-glucuronate isomerase